MSYTHPLSYELYSLAYVNIQRFFIRIFDLGEPLIKLHLSLFHFIGVRGPNIIGKK